MKKIMMMVVMALLAITSNAAVTFSDQLKMAEKEYSVLSNEIKQLADRILNCTNTIEVATAVTNRLEMIRKERKLYTKLFQLRNSVRNLERFDLANFDVNDAIFVAWDRYERGLPLQMSSWLHPHRAAAFNYFIRKGVEATTDPKKKAALMVALLTY